MEDPSVNAAEIPPIVCPYCGGNRLRRKGRTPDGKQKFFCKSCRRYFRAFAPPAAPVLRLPLPESCRVCGARGQLIYYGYRRDGAPIFRCKACGHNFSGRPREKGPFPYRVTLLLDPLSVKALIAYSQKHGLPDAEAVRKIFRQADQPLSALVKTGAPRLSYNIPGYAFRPRSVDPPPIKAPAGPPPDLRSQQFVRAKRERDEEGRFVRSVAVDLVFTVCLDQSALNGLLRTALSCKITRAEAARRLIRYAGTPRALPAVGGPRRVEF